MDPTECYRRMIGNLFASVADDDTDAHEAAADAAADLTLWLAAGGFPPKGMTVGEAGLAARNVLAEWLDEPYDRDPVDLAEIHQSYR